MPQNRSAWRSQSESVRDRVLTALDDARRARGPNNGRRRLPGMLPHLPWLTRRWSSMRTSWMLSRPILSPTRDRGGEAGIPGRRTITAWLLAGLVLSLILGLSGCGTGGGSDSATRPSTERTGTRPEPSGTESPSETTTEPTRPPRTTADTPASTRAPTTAERPSSPTTTPPATSAAGTPAAAESQGLGAFGWTLLILLVVALAAGWLLLRSRRKAAWDREAAALEADTRATTSTQLPSVLTAETAGERALTWPPLRAALSDLIGRWDLLAERSPDDQRRSPMRADPQPASGAAGSHRRREPGAGSRA